MFELRTVQGPEKRTGPRVACCIVTRSGREKYLKKTLDRLRRQPVDILLWANGPIATELAEGCVYFHQHDFNVGQHVAHNEMLDVCVKRGGYDWHVRIDDDCWMSSRTWLSRLLAVQEKVKKLTGRYCTLGPQVDGLEHPPETIKAFELGREIVEMVPILGGIFRLSPMGIMRYFRWDERQAMGFGDATQFKSFCESTRTEIFRVKGVRCTHGGSTLDQNAANPEWGIEHDMLQYIPLGL